MKKLLTAALFFVGMFMLAACDLDQEVEIGISSELEEATFTIEPADVVEMDTDVTVTAEEVEGYVFSHWEDVETGATLSMDETYTFTAQEDIELEAVYEQVASIILESEHEDATLTVAPEKVAPGNEVTIQAHELEGYVFDHWYDVDEDEVFTEESSYTFEVGESVHLEAVYVDEEISAAEDVIDEFEGDLSHLEDLVENLETSDALTMEMDFFIEVEGPEGMEQLQMNYTKRILDTDHLIMETVVTVDIPDSIDQEMDEITFHVLVEETEYLHNIYMDVGLLLDMIEEEEELDAREIFDFESDFLHVSVPHALIEDIWDEVFEEIEEDLPEDFDEELLEEIIEEMERFEKYLDFDYLNSLEHIEADIEIVDETDILTTLLLNPDMATEIFEDVFEDVYYILEMVDEDGEMPPYEDFVKSEEYAQIIEMIQQMPTLEVDFLHNPVDEDWLQVEYHLLPMLEEIEELELDELETLELTVSFLTEAEFDFDDPDEAKDVAEIAEDLLMLFMTMEATRLAHIAAEHPEIDEGVHTFADLVAIDPVFMFFPPIVDPEASEIEVTADDVYIDPVYDVNDEHVFVDPAALSELAEIDFEEPPADREDFLWMIRFANPQSIDFELKIFALVELMLEEGMPEDPIDPGDEFPEEDLVDLDDLDDVPRFPDSVMVDGEDTEDHSLRVYLTDTSLSDIHQFYLDHFDDEADWIVDDQSINEEEGEAEITAVTTDGRFVNIDIQTDEDLVIIGIFHTE